MKEQTEKPKHLLWFSSDPRPGKSPRVICSCGKMVSNHQREKVRMRQVQKHVELTGAEWATKYVDPEAIG